jgi:hypothetical protein
MVVEIVGRDKAANLAWKDQEGKTYVGIICFIYK